MDEKQIYQQLQKNVDRGKRKLLFQGIYLVLFWGLVLLLLAYFIPIKYYDMANKNPELQKATPTKVQETFLKEDTNDYLNLYRYYWFEMGQENLHYDYRNDNNEPALLGKKETYYLTSRIGEVENTVYQIEQRYLFSKRITTKTIGNDVLANQQIARTDNSVSLSYDEMVAMIKNFGKTKNIDLRVQLDLAAEPETVQTLAGGISVIHYGIEDGSGQPVFGYSDQLVDQATGNNYNKRVAKAVSQGLKYLVKYSPKYGNLALNESTVPSSQLLQQQLFYFQNHDFNDIQDYVKHNGIKVKALRITGNCNEIADWLAKNKSDISLIEVKGLADNVEAAFATKDLGE